MDQMTHRKAASDIPHVALEEDAELTQDTERGRNVIAAFGDRAAADRAAQRLVDEALDGAVTVRVRRPGVEVSEAESREEFSKTHASWIRHAVTGTVLGLIVGAVIGGAFAAAAVVLGLWDGSGAIVLGALVMGLAMAWAGAVTLGFRAQWQMSYRDVATGAEALVTFDTDRPEAAQQAFAVLRESGAQRVDRYDGELKFKYVSPTAMRDAGT